MFTVNDLRKAVMAGQLARVKKIVRDLKSQEVDLSEIKVWANKYNQVNGGVYQQVVDALE